MEQAKQSNKANIAKTLIVYLGGAWVIIEAINFLIDKYDLNTAILDVLILLVIFGLPAILIYTWFQQKFTRKAIILQAINGVIALAVIVFTLVNPGKLDPTQLRLLKFKNQQKQLAESIQSIVILPFDNYTGTDEFEYYVAGMHSGLIGDLGKISALRVISKTSSRLFKDVDLSIPEIATELGVDAVIEPSISCVGGDSVCVQIKLVSAFPEEQQLWVQDFRVAKDQILNFYNDVTKKISEEINIVLTPQEESLLAEAKTVNPEAYDAFLKAKHFWDQFTPEALQLALEYFNRAIEIDPDWGPPYAGLAYYWIAMRQFGLAPNSVTIPNIYENLEKATELDPNSAYTHYVSALATVWTGFKWDKGEKEFLKILEINPNDAFSRIYYAHLLSLLRRHDEAILQGKIALDLDPLNPMIQALYAMILPDVGRYDETIALSEKVHSVVPGHPIASSVKSLAYLYKKDYRKFLEFYIQVLPLENLPGSTILDTYDEKGLTSAIMLFIAELERTAGDRYPTMLGELYTVAGDNSKAMDWYEKAYKSHDPNLPYIGMYTYSYGAYKVDDKRFDALLEKLKLPPR